MEARVRRIDRWTEVRMADVVRTFHLESKPGFTSERSSAGKVTRMLTGQGWDWMAAIREGRKIAAEAFN